MPIDIAASPEIVAFNAILGDMHCLAAMSGTTPGRYMTVLELEKVYMENKDAVVFLTTRLAAMKERFPALYLLAEEAFNAVNEEFARAVNEAAESATT